MGSISGKKITSYIVEHLDPELGPWSTLEYRSIAQDSAKAGVRFFLSSVPTVMSLPPELRDLESLTIEHRSVEKLFQEDKGRVCLLDPAATVELSPEDGTKFDVFLFGGILGDDPPRDRTSELRKKGFSGRRLGPIQMTTDTAVRVTRMVVEQKVPLKDIPYVDYPELHIDENESTEMPFRYVKDADGSPCMPEGMVDLIKADSEKGFGDLL
ncbi:hypothetical protein HO173_003808 [Letharia columbiana]|uniref:DUF431 domain-containing protein n=1 Tax=Letharia columbiana TaxID=112416 RepID=A0A8H6G0C9_9LECA|nr:uncharacterized protein HO173_003808 [Letharia columbiana]KAF6238174.1 hypothetical protein HO173_003808 [Letharia columbiana]